MSRDDTERIRAELRARPHLAGACAEQQVTLMQEVARLTGELDMARALIEQLSTAHPEQERHPPKRRSAGHAKRQLPEWEQRLVDGTATAQDRQAARAELERLRDQAVQRGAVNYGLKDRINQLHEQNRRLAVENAALTAESLCHGEDPTCAGCLSGEHGKLRRWARLIRQLQEDVNQLEGTQRELRWQVETLDEALGERNEELRHAREAIGELFEEHGQSDEVTDQVFRERDRLIRERELNVGAGSGRSEAGAERRMTDSEFRLMLALLVQYASADVDQWERFSLSVADSRVYVRLAWQPQPPNEREEQYPLISPTTGRRTEGPA